MEKQRVKFLDYEIVNTNNGDDWVLKKINITPNNMWEYHLGNFLTLETAKEYAWLNFMIARPKHFSQNIISRLNGKRGLYHEWYTLVDVCKKENIDIPPEIQKSEDISCVIMYTKDI
jgi:hypothetical protein